MRLEGSKKPVAWLGLRMLRGRTRAGCRHARCRNHASRPGPGLVRVAPPSRPDREARPRASVGPGSAVCRRLRLVRAVDPADLPRPFRVPEMDARVGPAPARAEGGDHVRILRKAGGLCGRDVGLPVRFAVIPDGEEGIAGGSETVGAVVRMIQMPLVEGDGLRPDPVRRDRGGRLGPRAEASRPSSGLHGLHDLLAGRARSGRVLNRSRDRNTAGRSRACRRTGGRTAGRRRSAPRAGT